MFVSFGNVENFPTVFPGIVLSILLVPTLHGLFYSCCAWSRSRDWAVWSSSRSTRTWLMWTSPTCWTETRNLPSYQLCVYSPQRDGLRWASNQRRLCRDLFDHSSGMWSARIEKTNKTPLEQNLPVNGKIVPAVSLGDTESMKDKISIRPFLFRRFRKITWIVTPRLNWKKW